MKNQIESLSFTIAFTLSGHLDSSLFILHSSLFTYLILLYTKIPSLFSRYSESLPRLVMSKVSRLSTS